jgi:hypothetical protein
MVCLASVETGSFNFHGAVKMSVEKSDKRIEESQSAPKRLCLEHSSRSAAALVLFAAAAGAWGIFAEIGIQPDFGDRFNHPVQIIPAIGGFDKPADFVQGVFFALLDEISLEFDQTFAVFGAAFFGLDNFQFMPFGLFPGKIDRFGASTGIPGMRKVIGVPHGIRGKTRTHQRFGGNGQGLAGMKQSAALTVRQTGAAQAVFGKVSHHQKISLFPALAFNKAIGFLVLMSCVKQEAHHKYSEKDFLISNAL